MHIRSNFISRWPAVACLLFMPAFAQADEGMWTFNNFPSEKVQQA
jgi:hypothetical protein